MQLLFCTKYSKAPGHNLFNILPGRKGFLMKIVIDISEILKRANRMKKCCFFVGRYS
jgi:hypothetical protein